MEGAQVVMKEPGRGALRLFIDLEGFRRLMRTMTLIELSRLLVPGLTGEPATTAKRIQPSP